ncbi:MAG: hypothetical protein ACPGYP_06160 [Solirubrobacterales bacterium]
MKRSVVILAITVAVFAIFTAPSSAAKKGFKTGTYKAKSSAGSFKFKIYKGSCYVKLTSRKRRGYCLSGKGFIPQVNIVCPDVPNGPNDYMSNPLMPNQAWLPRNGKLNWINKGFHNGDEAYKYVFKLKLRRNGRASGSFSVTEETSSLKVKSTCKSATYRFSAKR